MTSQTNSNEPQLPVNAPDKLFQYIDKTFELVNEGILPQQVVDNLLLQVQQDYLNMPERFYYVGNVALNRTHEWFNFLFANDDDVLYALETAMMHKWSNAAMFDKVVEKFLTLDAGIKKDFYNTDFTEYKIERGRPHVILCERYCKTSQPVFHNIVSAYNVHHVYDKDIHGLQQKVITDMKNVLQLSHAAFLDRYGSALIITDSKENIDKQWKYLEVESRPDLLNIYATKYVERKFLKNTFLKDVEKQHVPYDLKNSNIGYLMTQVILSDFNELVTALNPYKKEPFITLLTEKYNRIKFLNENYDLYFFKESDLVNIKQSINDAVASKKNPELHAVVLEFWLNMQEIMNPVIRSESVKKIKI